MYDVIIIGAGVSGAAIARELSRYDWKVCVLEKGEDVCSGTSKANSAIVHAGFDAGTGTLMAKLNVKGNAMMDQLAEDLDIPFKRNGALVVCTDESAKDGLKELYDRGVANGVPGLQILDKEEIHQMEPNLTDESIAALYAPTSGIICPFELTMGMAENANMNGVEFFFHTEVQKIDRKEDGTYHLHTNSGDYDATYVINAAGVYADEIHNMICERKMTILARKGEYCLLDKEVGNYVSHTIFPQPTKLGKGVLVTPTVHGNLLVGPTALDLEDKEATNTTRAGLLDVIAKASANVKNLPMRKVITSFAGLRARTPEDEFVIEETAPNFIDCAGIESPGLSSSPAIGEMVREIIIAKANPKEKENWIATRKRVLDPGTLSFEERAKLIKEKPAYGNIICRCESVSEGEILDAIHRPLGARSLDAVKRRTRAGMGRCQSGFCAPKTMEILHRELGLNYTEITKSGGVSNLVIERTKEAKA